MFRRRCSAWETSSTVGADLNALFELKRRQLSEKIKTIHDIEPKRRWRQLLSRAKISDFHIHDLRRTLATYMANSGANVALIQSALNHKDLRTTLEVYAKVGRRAELEARAKAHELMLSSLVSA